MRGGEGDDLQEVRGGEPGNGEFLWQVCGETSGCMQLLVKEKAV